MKLKKNPFTAKNAKLISFRRGDPVGRPLALTADGSFQEV